MSPEQPPKIAPQMTRREIIKRAAYVTPAILTLTAMPAFASRGSAEPRRRGQNPKEHRRKRLRLLGDE
jgi:hypothetical protein